MQALIRSYRESLSQFITENRTALAGLVLFFIIQGTFTPCLGNGFVNWDDNEYVYLNSHVKSGLTLSNILWALHSNVVANWHPLTMILHMLNYQIFGLQPWGHHLVNLLLHSATVVLVFLLLKQMTGAFWKSWVLAALFGLHPLRVESVAWVAELKDVLSTFFWILTLLCYVGYVVRLEVKPKEARIYYGLALFTTLLGVMSKPMLVTIPFTLFLLDFWPLRRWKKGVFPRLIMEKVPFMVLCAILGIITCFAQSEAMYPKLHMTMYVRVANALISYCRYLGKIFFPFDLAAYYPYPIHWPVLYVVLSSVFLVAFSLLVLKFSKGRPFLLFGWLWFLGTLLPVIGIIQVGSQSIADRYTYVPSIGILIMAIWGIPERLCRAIPLVLGWLLVAGICIGCLFQTRRQISYWKNDETLFRHAAEVTGTNYIASLHVGISDLVKSNYTGAVSNFTIVLAAKPSMVAARIYMGESLVQLGKPEEAVQVLSPSLFLDPTNASVNLSLAHALLAEKKYNDVVTNLQRAELLEPNSAKVKRAWQMFSNAVAGAK
jgi:tetratricopeptide (TPR) repeat protein